MWEDGGLQERTLKCPKALIISEMLIKREVEGQIKVKMERERKEGRS